MFKKNKPSCSCIGFVKKIITETGNEFIVQLNTDMSLQKKNTGRTEVLNAYLTDSWNLTYEDCPLAETSSLLTDCSSSSDQLFPK